MNDLRHYIGNYLNDGEHNDWLYHHFTEETDKIPFLREHRNYIEHYKLGFGDRAFHFMWLLLVSELSSRYSNPRLLEIGVYKGQVISLWSLLARELGINTEITCITPLEGNVSKNYLVNNRLTNKIRMAFSASYRQIVSTGNIYEKDDYEIIIRTLFEHFGLTFGYIEVLRGYSNEVEILNKARKRKYDLIYIDGDHSYEGVLSDIMNYSELISDGGFMVMDDASWYIDGSAFWKGHEEVSRACREIEGLGFTNVLNVGHNRIYEKTKRTHNPIK